MSNDPRYRVSGKDNIPLWVQAAMDQRLAELRIEQEIAKTNDAVVITTLKTPPKNATQKQIDRWELSCDNCGRYFPDGEGYLSYQIKLDDEASRMVAGFVFGSCKPCSEMP